MLQRCSSSPRLPRPRAIRAVYEQRGEFAAAVELRQRFPGITDNTQARACARTVAGWKPLPVQTSAIVMCGWLSSCPIGS